MFLIVVDAHSKLIDAQIINSTSAEAKLCTIFATHGLPEQLVSDKGSMHSLKSSWTAMESNIFSPLPTANLTG